MKLSTVIKGLAVSVCICVGAAVILLSVLILKPHKVTVAGVPSGFTEKKADIGGVMLNYVEGPDNGIPVLLIPGQMESWQGYKLVMSELAKTFHVYIVDIRGHGKSEHTPGKYSYNIVGNDLRIFLKQIIKKPVIVSGLSSGAVLSAWLGAYAPDYVLAVVSEDPPMFTSIWPAIKEEKFMMYGFENLIRNFGDPAVKNYRGYFSGMGFPKPDEDKLNYIPAGFANLVVNIYETNKKIRPKKQDDPPFLPLNVRLLFKYLNEYDVDFSRAAIDGRLSKGFNPEETLKKIKCPMLLMQANWSRHKIWGILGAMDDDDAAKIKALVKNIEYIKIDSTHDIHAAKSAKWLETFKGFVAGLQ